MNARAPMKAGTFWALMALIGILAWLGWHYLPTWPKWVSYVWVFAVLGLSAYGFIAKARDFFIGHAKNEDANGS